MDVIKKDITFALCCMDGPMYYCPVRVPRTVMHLPIYKFSRKEKTVITISEQTMKYL